MRRVLLYLALERVTCEALEVKRRDATRIGYRAKIDERVERRRSKILIIVPCARGAHATARPRTLHMRTGVGTLFSENDRYFSTFWTYKKTL